MKRNSFHTSMVVFLLLSASSVRAEVIDFEDWTLDADSAWIGPVPEDEGIDQPGLHGGTDRIGELQSGSVRFVNRHNLRFGSWSGFGISNQTDKTTPGAVNQTSSFAGGGAGVGDDHYAIGFGYVDEFDPNNADQLNLLPNFRIPSGTYVSSVSVTNTTYAALSILNGDSFTKPFGGLSGADPDFFRLSVFGVDENGQLIDDVVETFLADFRAADNLIVDDWEQLDLSPLREASQLFFNLDSTVSNEAGMVTPAYFALDNIVLQQDTIGDFDRDGFVTIADANILCSGIANNSSNSSFDLDGNGSVAPADLDRFLAAAGTLPGDANFDQSVQFDDFLIFSGSFGNSGNWSQGDFDCDGIVGFPDFLSLSKNFGITAQAVVAVPEPRNCNGYLLVLLGLLRVLLPVNKHRA